MEINSLNIFSELCLIFSDNYSKLLLLLILEKAWCFHVISIPDPWDLVYFLVYFTYTFIIKLNHFMYYGETFPFPIAIPMGFGGPPPELPFPRFPDQGHPCLCANGCLPAGVSGSNSHPHLTSQMQGQNGNLILPNFQVKMGIYLTQNVWGEHLNIFELPPPIDRYCWCSKVKEMHPLVLKKNIPRALIFKKSHVVHTESIIFGSIHSFFQSLVVSKWLLNSHIFSPTFALSKTPPHHRSICSFPRTPSSPTKESESNRRGPRQAPLESFFSVSQPT